MQHDIPSAEVTELAPNLAAAVRRAIGHLMAGGVVIGPTESAYGIFARATDAAAVERVAVLKHRPEGVPLPVVVADGAALAAVAYPPTEAEVRLMQYFWPGPLTVVLQARPEVPQLVTAGSGTVGVRVSPHPVTAALARAVGPITATSANLSGGPLARRATELDVALLLTDVLVLDGGACVDAPSTVVQVGAEGAVTVLREGPITQRQIEAVLGQPG